ncbi:MAG TPA: iron ABC transporter permease [Burkholderiaceae bacterium]|nr:iron ABC transporter permease [Burkholderiaceae bacterium]
MTSTLTRRQFAMLRADDGLGRALSLVIVCGAFVALPVLSVFASFWRAGESSDTLQHLAATVIPSALLQTSVLGVAVIIGVVAVGSATAWLVATCDFAGRRTFEWALLLPLSMPAYIVAYAYTDYLQYAGPLQTVLRDNFGWQRGDYWFPEIRSLGGAAFVFIVVLYPYVYLLARTAFLARTAAMMDAARSLGLTAWQTWWRVNLPIARPAIAAGALLALMETIADYGAASYFGLQTFTTSIYRAWFSLGDRLAASQLAAVLLLIVLALFYLEHRTRGRARFFTPTASQRPASRTVLMGGRSAGTFALCALPVLLGFVVPVILLLRLLVPAWQTVDWSRYAGWLANTLMIGIAAAIVALAAVLAIAYTARSTTRGAPRALVRSAVRLMSLGYAVPGAVIAVGILVPLAAFDNRLDAVVQSALGVGTGLLLTGSMFALLYGYLVRYFAVAYQSVEAGLTRITPAMDASARSLGSTPFDTFVRVHLPILRPSVLAAGLLVFVDVMKELPATLVLRPFNFDTLAVIAYQMASDERLGQAALPALTIVVAGVVPVALLSRAISRASEAGRAA